jgi:hypothetical protein
MVAGQPVEKGKELSQQQTSAIDMALKMNPENAKNYPKWLIDQYNKSKSAGTAPATSAAAPSGGDAASNAETPAMGSPSQAAAAPTATPNDDGSVPPKDESKGGAGSPNGSPAASTPSASTPPAPGATPAPAEPKPIVMNNESTQNSSSSGGGETNNVAGQNLPMIAHNQHLQQYLAKQNIGYQ